MGRPQKYRGVRQRHWGSWVSEIRHPLLKTRVWLGTFETAEDAARAFDEAARIMSGPRAKTNFPLDPDAPLPATTLLSSSLIAKLQKCQQMSQGLEEKGVQPHYPVSDVPLLRTDRIHVKPISTTAMKKKNQSLTCLRLDPEGENLGVWHKGCGGKESKSNWVMTLQLDNENAENHTVQIPIPKPSSSISVNNGSVKTWPGVAPLPSTSGTDTLPSTNGTENHSFVNLIINGAINGSDKVFSFTPMSFGVDVNKHSTISNTLAAKSNVNNLINLDGINASTNIPNMESCNPVPSNDNDEYLFASQMIEELLRDGGTATTTATTTTSPSTTELHSPSYSSIDSLSTSSSSNYDSDIPSSSSKYNINHHVLAPTQTTSSLGSLSVSSSSSNIASIDDFWAAGDNNCSWYLNESPVINPSMF